MIASIEHPLAFLFVLLELRNILTPADILNYAQSINIDFSQVYRGLVSFFEQLSEDECFQPFISQHDFIGSKFNLVLPDIGRNSEVIEYSLFVSDIR